MFNVQDPNSGRNQSCSYFSINFSICKITIIYVNLLMSNWKTNLILSIVNKKSYHKFIKLGKTSRRLEKNFAWSKKIYIFLKFAFNTWKKELGVVLAYVLFLLRLFWNFIFNYTNVFVFFTFRCYYTLDYGI